MEKEKIVQRCRKVFIPVADNRIFSDGPGGGEFDFVQVFRKEGDALRTLEAKKHLYAFDKPEKALIKRQIVAFYLVPAKVIE